MAQRILFLLSNFKPGGAERQYAYLLRGIDRQEFDVHVGFIEYQDSVVTVEFVRWLGVSHTHTFCRKSRWDFSVITNIACYIRDNRIEVVQSLLFMDNQVARFAGRLAGVRVVTSIRGEIGPLLGKAKTWYEFRAQALSDRVVVNSGWLGEYAISLGTCRNKLVVIPNGIEPDRFVCTMDRQELRGKYHLPVDTFLVGIVARLHPMKDHMTFLRVILTLLHEGRNVHAAIAGDGALRDELEAFVEQENLTDNVTFLGSVKDGIAECYQMMDVCLLTSQYGESFPNVVLEAMSAGTPVIATRVAAVPEIISDGQNGFVVSVGDVSGFVSHINRMITTPGLGEQLAGEARVTVRQYSVENMVARYEELYSEL